MEIFINTPMETLMQRDQKGIYSGYHYGAVQNIAGKVWLLRCQFLLVIQIPILLVPSIIIIHDFYIRILRKFNTMVESVMAYDFGNIVCMNSKVEAKLME